MSRREFEYSATGVGASRCSDANRSATTTGTPAYCSMATDRSSALRLQRYAELGVRVGVNLQAGQTLFLGAHVKHAPLAEAVVREAYKAGAAYVDVRWRDERIRRAMIELGPDEALTYTPSWLKVWAEAQDGNATLWIGGDPEPDVMANIDGERLGSARMAELIEVQLRQMSARSVNWSGFAYPSEGWAQKVFGEPDVERLWEAVAYCTRLDEPDPVDAWRQHMTTLEQRARTLNELALDSLRYTGPGTSLTIGLAPNARWTSALYKTADGIEYVPNLPTEEVFTTPDCRRAEGTIRATKPLVLNGQIVENLRLEVREGQIVRADADRGVEVVRAQLAAHERAGYFGEVALVDESSRVGRLQTTFFDTLYDENATAHIAFGAGIPQVFDGEPGGALNVATVHTDFMVGSPELLVEGITTDGRSIPLLRDGRWQPA
jgi:aminopeptidase